MPMHCEGECHGRVTSHELLGEDEDGEEIWGCDACGQVRGREER